MIVNIIERENARRMMMQMSKVCPLMVGHYGDICLMDQCRMWCPEIEEVYTHKQNKHFRAGCGLMPKDNREFSP